MPNHNAEPGANAIALPPVSTLCLLEVDVNELIVIFSPAAFNAVDPTIDTSNEALPNATDRIPAAPASMFSVKKIPKDVTKEFAGMKLANSLFVVVAATGIVTDVDFVVWT